MQVYIVHDCITQSVLQLVALCCATLGCAALCFAMLCRDQSVAAAPPLPALLSLRCVRMQYHAPALKHMLCWWYHM